VALTDSLPSTSQMQGESSESAPTLTRRQLKQSLAVGLEPSEIGWPQSPRPAVASRASKVTTSSSERQATAVQSLGQRERPYVSRSLTVDRYPSDGC
jgi:hypothetical protein